MSSSQQPGESNHAAISIRDVGKCYEIYRKPIDRLKQTLWRGQRRFFTEFWALRNVSLQVKPGEAVGIIGRNGSGKSTLLQIIAGTLRPTAGEVEVRGRVAALLELGSGFNPEFSGRENVFLNGAILGLSADQVTAKFDDIASFADIGEFIERPVKTYSTGMLVRLAFAVHAMLEPDILIVDEALAVGDASFQRRCYRHLESLQARGVSILFVSHSLELVRSICDTALYLEHGAVKASGEAAGVCDAYLTDLLAEQIGSTVAPVGDTQAATPVNENEGATLCVFSSQAGGPTTEQGSRAIEVIHAEIRTNQNGGHALYEGDSIRIRATLRANRAMSSFLFGLLFRDRYGADIFGFSTPSRELGFGVVQPGQEMVVEAVVKCSLRADTYFVTLGLQADGFEEVYYYGHDILKFAVESPASALRHRMIGGVARLEYSIAGVMAAIQESTDEH